VAVTFDGDAPLLEVEGLAIEYRTPDGRLRAVDDVDFRVARDETLGLVGESGCGKSTIARAILDVLDRNGEVAAGEIRFKGVDLTGLTAAELNDVRWNGISMISQSAMNALNPVHRISAQIVEAIQAHEDVTDAEARERVVELFELVGLNPNRIDDYPHQFSGGMKQRAYIAMALALDPDLLIADEPTTALDVIVQDQILKRLGELRRDLGISMLLITHDISVVAETCDRLGVMYAGKLMEYGDIESIFEAPYNPYTLGLQNSFPSVSETRDLISIPGTPPDLSDPPEGCRFAARCPFATDGCLDAHPPLEAVDDDHYSACYRHDIVDRMREDAGDRGTWQRDPGATVPDGAAGSGQGGRTDD